MYLFNKKFFSLFCFILFLFFLAFSAFVPFFFSNFKKSVLYISGSSSMQEIIEKLGGEFSELNPDIEVLKTGNGSTQAIHNVKSQVSQIGDLSRPLFDFEDKGLFDIHIIAKDAIALCTNKKNKLKNISSDNLKKIFQKKITNWNYFSNKNNNIVLVGRDFASGTRQIFEKFLNLSGQIKYDIELENNGKVKYKLQNDEDAIGYLSINSVDDSLNIVKIDGVYPSIENIKNSKYHITHPLLQITKKGAKDSISDAWFNFIFSEKGAAILKQNRFIPVPKN